MQKTKLDYVGERRTCEFDTTATTKASRTGPICTNCKLIIFSRKEVNISANSRFNY